MSIDTLATHLLRLEVFQDLAPAQLNDIARRAERMIYKPGQLLIADGEPGDAAVLVIAGDAVRIKGQNDGQNDGQNEGQNDGLAADGEHEAIEPGSLLGEMTMLIETEYSSTVVANGPVRALRLRRDAMLELMIADPTLAEHFVQKIARRLTRLAVELRLIEQTLGSMEQVQDEQGHEPFSYDHGGLDIARTTAIAPPA